MASTYLTRTFGTPTDTKIYTFSCWVKRSKLGVQQTIARSTNGNDDSHVFTFNSDDTLRWDEYGNSSTIGTLKTNRLFRDTNAWYHVVLAWDTTNATAGDRMKMWINGVEETSFATDTNPSLNATSAFNKASQPINIGRTSYGGGADYFDGSMAHYHFIDGTAYDASAFGETDATTGIWKPKTAPSVTYGTNGFFLKFASSGSMGTDSSGNGNDFTVSGNLTQTQDTPSNVFCTLNPLAQSGGISFDLTNGNLTLGDNGAGDNDQGMAGTLAVSKGKYYWEVKTVNGGEVVGVKTTDSRIVFSATDGTPNSGYWGFQSNGTGISINTYSDGTFNNSNTLQGHDNNAIVMFALDMDNGKLFYGRDGSWLGVDNASADPAAGTNAAFTNIPTDGTFMTIWTEHRSSGDPATHWNFGNGYFGTTAVSSAQSPSDGIGLFEYSVPSGYKALCTKSINSQEYS